MLAEPRISANKLAEYLIKRAARQRKLLHERKYPDPDFSQGAYYKEAAESATLFVADGADDVPRLMQRIQALQQQNPEKVGTARRLKSNIDALQKFEGMLDDLDLMGGLPELGPSQAAPLVYYGVRVSVRPEIILRSTGPKGKKYIGAIKFNFSTGFVHNEESAGYVSAMVQEHLRQHVVKDEVIKSDYCQVIDVGGQQIFPGVKSTAQRLADIEAECQNIADLWPGV